jgi:hypothetical protein
MEGVASIHPAAEKEGVLGNSKGLESRKEDWRRH